MKKIFVVLWLLCASQLQAAECQEQVVQRNSTWGNVARASASPQRGYTPSRTVTPKHSTASVQIQRMSSTTSPSLYSREDPYDVVVSPDMAAARPMPPAYIQPRQENRN